MVSQKPHKFPLSSHLVVEIVSSVVDTMTTKYMTLIEKEESIQRSPPYDLLCKKVALMDLALQAFLNVVTQEQMGVLLGKLDDLTGSHKSTMCPQWHEVQILWIMSNVSY